MSFINLRVLKTRGVSLLTLKNTRVGNTLRKTWFFLIKYQITKKIVLSVSEIIIISTIRKNFIKIHYGFQ